MKSLHNFMGIMKYGRIMLNDNLFISLSHYLKKLFKSVSVRKCNLKFCTVASTKDSHLTPKNHISVAATSITKKHFHIKQTSKPVVNELRYN